MATKNILIREYVRHVLNELNPQTDYGDSLDSVFVEPFRDAAKVVKGELSKISTKAAGVITKVVTSTLHMLGPQFFDQKFDEIDEFVTRGITAIEKDKNYSSSIEKIRPHARTAAEKIFFLADPVGFITTVVVSKSGPVEAYNVASMFWESAKDSRSAERAKAIVEKVKNKNTNNKTQKHKRNRQRPSEIDTGTGVEEGQLYEADTELPDEVAKEIIDNPEIQQIIRESIIARGLSSKLSKVAKGTEDEFLKMGKAISDASDAKTLSQIFGIKIDETQFNTLDKESTMSETLFVAQIKQESLKRLVDAINKHLKRVGYAGQKNNAYYDAMIDAGKQVAKMAEKN